MTTDEKRPIQIMVVDDTPANLDLLDGLLRRWDYQVRAFPNARLALTSALNEPPDLLLLDISMPDMDGYEACRRFKAEAALQSIPVIFISALSDPLDKAKAFGCGGVDYVAKPFQLDEVQIRIETHLKIRHLQNRLEAQNQQLLGLFGNLERIAGEKSSLSEATREGLTNAIAAGRKLIEMTASPLATSQPESGRRPGQASP